MGLLDLAHIFSHLELDMVVQVHGAHVTMMIVSLPHFHQLRWEKTISVTDLMVLIIFGLEKAAELTIHAAHSTILPISVYNCHQ